MHSGPVTAGVLRGERARFQLFGDTVNTGESLLSIARLGMKQTILTNVWIIVVESSFPD